MGRAHRGHFLVQDFRREIGASAALSAAAGSGGEIENAARTFLHSLPDGRFRHRVADTDVHISGPKRFK